MSEFKAVKDDHGNTRYIKEALHEQPEPGPPQDEDTEPGAVSLTELVNSPVFQEAKVNEATEGYNPIPYITAQTTLEEPDILAQASERMVGLISEGLSGSARERDKQFSDTMDRLRPDAVVEAAAEAGVKLLEKQAEIEELEAYLARECAIVKDLSVRNEGLSMEIDRLTLNNSAGAGQLKRTQAQAHELLATRRRVDICREKDRQLILDLQSTVKSLTEDRDHWQQAHAELRSNMLGGDGLEACSFCHTVRAACDQLVASEGVCICTECIELAADVIGYAAPEREQQEGDAIDPDHYRDGDIECIDAIRAALGEAGFKGFCQGNAIKYLWRYALKGKPDQDLLKSAWYTSRLRGVLGD